MLFFSGSLTSRSNEGSGGEGSHGNTTLLVSPQIGKGTTDQGHGSRKSDTVNGTANKQSANVLGDGAGNDEDDGQEKGRSAIRLLVCNDSPGARFFLWVTH